MIFRFYLSFNIHLKTYIQSTFLSLVLIYLDFMTMWISLSCMLKLIDKCNRNMFLKQILKYRNNFSKPFSVSVTVGQNFLFSYRHRKLYVEKSHPEKLNLRRLACFKVIYAPNSKWAFNLEELGKPTVYSVTTTNR